ncbi:MAG: hypothetical protein Q4D51_05545 [Eubacteriales bacterium]|nr:hypothetical protein [Eubacteriales bacterium]
MELKLSNQEENENKSGGLKLSGGSDFSQTNVKKEKDNPWDFQKENDVIEVKSISNTAMSEINAHTNTYQSANDDTHIVVKIGKIVVYACMIFMIGSMIWICNQPQVDMYQCLMNLSPMYSVCELAFIIDAVMVNVLYDKKISLIIWSIVFPFIYPMKRDKHVDRGGAIGVVGLLAYLAVVVALVSNVMTSLTKYGTLVMNPNQEIRSTAVAFLDTMQKSGDRTFGNKLQSNLTIEDIQVEIKGSTTTIMVIGMGRYEVRTDGIMDYVTNKVPTELVFQKDGNSNYHIVGAVTNNTTLSNSNVEAFWNLYMH